MYPENLTSKLIQLQLLQIHLKRMEHVLWMTIIGIQNHNMLQKPVKSGLFLIQPCGTGSIPLSDEKQGSANFIKGGSLWLGFGNMGNWDRERFAPWFPWFVEDSVGIINLLYDCSLNFMIITGKKGNFLQESVSLINFLMIPPSPSLSTISFTHFKCLECEISHTWQLTFSWKRLIGVYREILPWNSLFIIKEPLCLAIIHVRIRGIIL